MDGQGKKIWLFLNYILRYIVDIELMLDSIKTTTYLSLKKAKQVKSTLSSAHRSIQEANSVIISKHIVKSRQMTLHEFGMK